METILQYQRPRNTKDRIDFCVTEWFKRNGVFLICGNWKWLTRFESTFTPLSEKNLRASFAGGLKNRMNNTRKKKKCVHFCKLHDFWKSRKTLILHLLWQRIFRDGQLQSLKSKFWSSAPEQVFASHNTLNYREQLARKHFKPKTSNT